MNRVLLLIINVTKITQWMLFFDMYLTHPGKGSAFPKCQLPWQQRRVTQRAVLPPGTPQKAQSTDLDSKDPDQIKWPWDLPEQMGCTDISPPHESKGSAAHIPMGGPVSVPTWVRAVLVSQGTGLISVNNFYLLHSSFTVIGNVFVCHCSCGANLFKRISNRKKKSY